MCSCAGWWVADLFDSTLGFPGEGPGVTADAREANAYYQWMVLAGRLVRDRHVFGVHDLGHWARQMVMIVELAPPPYR